MHDNPVNSVNPENPDSDNKQPLGPDNVSGSYGGRLRVPFGPAVPPANWKTFQNSRVCCQTPNETGRELVPP